MEDILTRPEFVKAALRDRHGSIYAFERANDLAHRSVSDVFNGKRSLKTAKAIAKEVGRSVHEIFPNYESTKEDDNTVVDDTHSLNEGAE